ncbi:MAG: glycosyltransferase, partial [Vicinamibacterales bacterium]
MVDQDVVDLCIVVDDASQDRTLSLARSLEKVVAYGHQSNRGYGANQKTCYRLALE